MAQGQPPTYDSPHDRPTATGDELADPHATRGPEDLHRKLEAFIGRWNVSGRNADAAPAAPNSAIRGENHFEWLQGQFFVIGRFRHANGSGTHSGVSIMGITEPSGELFAHNFDNLGYERRYTLSFEGGVFRFTGQLERATLVFGQDGHSYEERWEISKDGQSFSALCELHATKLGAHA